MASWKKVIVSGSDAELNKLSVSNGITGSLFGLATSASYVTGSVFNSTNPATSASYAVTASFALNTGAPTFPYTGSAIISGSLIVTGSVTSDIGFTGSLFGTSSWAINSITSSNNILQSSILTNQTVGGLSSGTSLNSGTSVESILRQILITYINPTVSSLSFRNGLSAVSFVARDVNNSFVINTASFNAAQDNPNLLFPVSASVTASNADTTFTQYLSNTTTATNLFSLGSDRTINRATSAGTVTFTLNARRATDLAAITAATTTVAFQWRNWLSATATVVTDNATAQTAVDAAVTSQLDTDKAWNPTCTAANNDPTKFTYIIYPSSFGTLTSVIQNGSIPVLTAFTNLGTFTVTNAYGASISVYVYKSNAAGAFANGTVLTIT